MTSKTGNGSTGQVWYRLLRAIGAVFFIGGIIQSTYSVFMVITADNEHAVGLLIGIGALFLGERVWFAARYVLGSGGPSIHSQDRTPSAPSPLDRFLSDNAGGPGP